MKRIELNRGATFWQTIAFIIILIVLCAYLIDHPQNEGLLKVLREDAIVVWDIIKNIADFVMNI